MPALPRFPRPTVFLLSGALGFGLFSQTPTGPVYTTAQADAGGTAYQERCASCHMADLGGREDAPALAGDAFLTAWKGKSTTDLFEFVRDTMPPEGPTLAPEMALAVVAHVLRENGATAGPAPLAATTAAPIAAIATGRRPPVSRAGGGGGLRARSHLSARAACSSRSPAC